MIEEKKQIRINLITNIFSLIASIIIGVFYTPYLVRTLGVIAYGIVPLALIINQYINVFTGSLTGSLTRFYSIALQKGNKEEASRYLSTSLVAILTILIFISPLIIILVTKIDQVFNIPKDLILDAKSLFLFTIISFVFSVFSSILNITLYALNRLDLLNVIKIIRISFKFILVIYFFEMIQKNVGYIGYANFFSELLVFGISILLFLRVSPRGIRISFNLFDKVKLISVFGMTIWVLLHQFGDTALYRTDNILVNIFWSTKESGTLGALSEFGIYVMLVVSTISSLFGPVILIAYSNDQHYKVQMLTLNSSLIVGVLSAILTGVLIGFSNSIISFWLSPDFSYYSSWFIIKLISIPFIASSGIFAFTYRSWNKVRYPALITLIIGFCNFGISYIIYYFYKDYLHIISIVLTFSALLVIIQSYILNAYFFINIYEGNGRKVIKNFFIILFILMITSLISFLIEHFYNIDKIYFLILAMFSSGLISSIIAYYTVVSDSQKKILLDLIKNQIKL